VPQLHEPFGTQALDATGVLVVLLFAVLPSALLEAAKAVGRLHKDAGNPQDAPSVPGSQSCGHA
jgi:hypothetical protein